MNYEGIEIGAVSVKWVRLSSEEMVYRNLKKGNFTGLYWHPKTDSVPDIYFMVGQYILNSAG